MSFRTVRWSRIVVVSVWRSEPVLKCGRRARVPGERTAASLLGVQIYRIRLSLHLPEASETSGLLPLVGNPWQTSCLSLPVGYTASLKKPGIDFFSAACIIKRKLSLNLSQQTRVPRMTRKKQNKARHPHLQKVEFFTITIKPKLVSYR